MPTQLFAFPFAGGSSYSYNPIFEHLPTGISSRTFELPGRGAKSRLPLNPDLRSLAGIVYEELKSAGPGKCVLYGHSMGALLAYLVVRQIKNSQDHIEVSHLVVSGCTPPSYREVPKLSALPDEELIQQIIHMDGTPNDLWKEKELWDFFIPVIRSDFRAFEEYIYEKEPPLNVPLTVITGTDELVKDHHLKGWNDITSHPVDFQKMPGGHFFINEHAKEMAELLASKSQRPVGNSAL